jgi:hypothetical protein
MSEGAGGRLPHLENAVVAEAKITHYLLSSTHSTGRDKAAFFTRFGFTLERWEDLRAALLEHAAAHAVADAVPIHYGVNYVIVGELSTPDGRNPRIRAIWCIDHGSETPRFITAYPE